MNAVNRGDTMPLWHNGNPVKIQAGDVLIIGLNLEGRPTTVVVIRENQAEKEVVYGDHLAWLRPTSQEEAQRFAKFLADMFDLIDVVSVEVVESLLYTFRFV